MWKKFLGKNAHEPVSDTKSSPGRIVDAASIQAVLTAIKEGDAGGLKFGLSMGVNPNTVHKYGVGSASLLAIAAQLTPNPEIIDILAAAGADVSYKHHGAMTILMLACRFNPNPEVIRAIGRAGVDVNERTFMGSAMSTAREFNKSLVGVLVELGAVEQNPEKHD